jgi:hypothetical protein
LKRAGADLFQALVSTKVAGPFPAAHAALSDFSGVDFG